MSATVEDLLKLLEESDESPASSVDKVDKTKIDDFIGAYFITEGPCRIPTHVIYYTYKVKYGGDLSKIEFFRQFKKKFEQRRTGRQRVYMLDESSFDMSREGLIEAEFFAESHKRKKSGKEKKR